MTNRPVPWPGSHIPTLWLDPSTGYGVNDRGERVAPVIRGRRKHPVLEDLLNTAQVSGAKRIVLTGSVPAGLRDGRHWLQSDTEGWRHGAHWLSTPPTGRYFHNATQPREREKERPYEISFASAWFGAAVLSPAQAQKAWDITEKAVTRVEPTMKGLLKSPASTGLNLWAYSMPSNLEPEPIDMDIAAEIHATSGQHHMDHLVAGPNFAEHPDCVPLMRQMRGESMQQFSYIDGRFMYAACCNELGVGPARRMRGAECAGLFMDPRGRFAPARYSVRVRIPDEWRHVGILGVQSKSDRETWIYPNRPGATVETWVDAAELRVAQDFGWHIEAFFEGIEFQAKKAAKYGEPRPVAARPLDTFADRIKKARGVVAGLENVDPTVQAAAIGALRSILIQGIGSFASRGKSSTVEVSSTWDVPAEYEHTIRVYGDRVTYQQPSALTERQRAYYRPELAAQVWGRARARVLHGPGADGGKTGALHVDPETLIGINGDAVYTTSLPSWALPVAAGGADDGKEGRLRLKGYLPGGEKDMALPTTVAARNRLMRRAEAAGTDAANQL